MPSTHKIETAGSSKSKSKALTTNSRDVAPDASLSTAGSGVTLDASEVMRAMLAARPAVGGPDEPDGSDDDEASSGSAEDNGSDHEELSAKEGAAVIDEDDEEDDDQPGPSTRPSPPPSRVPAASTSRVVLSRTADVKGKSKSVFDAAPKPSAETTFESLGLSRPVIMALAAMRITKPTEIQAACVGQIMGGRDCIGGAKTGSGKTMAFALPILERIARDPFGVYAVVLTPTRELAYQLTEQFLAIGRPLGLTTTTIVGGMDTLAQARALALRPHVVIATPGRLVDLLRSDPHGPNPLVRVRVLVLDEADRMLTPTFAPELAFLFDKIPKTRQTCLFTATISDAIMALAEREPALGKQRPFVYRVESDTLTVDRLKQQYLFIPSQIRDSYLYYLLLHPPSSIDIALRSESVKPASKPAKKSKDKRKADDVDDDPTPFIPSTIIFAQRCASAHLLHLLLNTLDIPAVALHSHLTQPQRLRSLARFRAREVPVLVTTDVGSRGLDIPEVAMVINWDCPRRADDYVHRVGRTARAGRGGVAVTVVTERDVELVQKIEEEVKVKLEELELPEEDVLENLNKVSLARRMATMEMHDSGFGERQATNKAKAIKRARRDAAIRDA
ncbi:putative RNA helicase [Cryptotrichosporon argae]